MNSHTILLVLTWVACVYVLSGEVFEFHPAAPVDLGPFCCNTTPYNITERYSFVNYTHYQVVIQQFRQDPIDGCHRPLRPMSCLRNITTYRHENRVRTSAAYKTVVTQVLCDSADIACCEGYTNVEGHCFTDEEKEAYYEQQQELDDLLDGLW